MDVKIYYNSNQINAGLMIISDLLILNINVSKLLTYNYYYFFHNVPLKKKTFAAPLAQNSF